MNINKHIDLSAARLGVEKDIKKMSDLYLPMYENTKDPVHGIGHIKHVVSDALDIMLWLKANDRPLNYDDTYMVLLACYCHDLFTTEDRKNHHILGCRYVRNNTNDPFINKLRSFDRETLGTAIYEHRASNQPYRFNSIVGEVLASADRGAPVLSNVVNRIISNGDITTEIVNRVSEKYGTFGYVKYPNLYIEYYGRNKIDLFHKDVDQWVRVTSKEIAQQEEHVPTTACVTPEEDPLNNNRTVVQRCDMPNNVTVGSSARLDDDISFGKYNSIGDYADIGHRAILGDYIIVGRNAQIGTEVSVMSYVVIGDDVVISSSAEIGHKTALDDEVVVGMGTTIGNDTRIFRRTVIRDDCHIENNVMIMPDVYIHNNVTIKKNSVIGKGVRILEGLTVSGVIPPYTLVTESTSADS